MRIAAAGLALTWLLQAAGPGANQPRLLTPRDQVEFSGRLAAGEIYERRFGPGFIFALEPNRTDGERFPGWTIVIREQGRDYNLTDATIPLRGPRQMYLLASYLLPGVNAPGLNRVLAFSPQVGRSITDMTILQAEEASARDQVNRVYEFGRVEFDVRDFELTGIRDVLNVGFRRLSFRARISWPSDYRPEPTNR